MENSGIEKKNIEEILEEDTLSFDKSEEFYIKYWSYNRSVSEMLEMYDNGEIVIPDLQREYVWNYSQASLFIDSILRGLPIPSFFVTEINGKYLMIDGLQRLHTLYLYKKGIRFSGWDNPTKEFNLNNKNSILKECANRTFDKLDGLYQKRIERAMMNIIEFNQISPSENYSAMYQIFERINSTGRSLDAQEVRNAAYYSKFNHDINEFSNEIVFKELYPSTKSINRAEILVRWFTIKAILDLKEKNEYNKKQVSLKNDMNEFMAIYQAIDFELPIEKDKFPNFSTLFTSLNFNYKEELKKVKEVLVWMKDNLGLNAFCNIKSFENEEYNFKNTLHPTLAESIFLACYFEYDYLITNSKNYRLIANEVIYKPEYQEKLIRQTTTIESIEYRINELRVAFRR